MYNFCIRIKIGKETYHLDGSYAKVATAMKHRNAIRNGMGTGSTALVDVYERTGNGPVRLVL